MAAITVTVSRVLFEPVKNRVFVTFSDGTSYEFNSRADLDAAIDAIGDPRELAKRLALAIWKARGIVNGTELTGKKVTLDLSANAWGTIA